MCHEINTLKGERNAVKAKHESEKMVMVDSKFVKGVNSKVGEGG